MDERRVWSRRTFMHGISAAAPALELLFQNAVAGQGGAGVSGKFTPGDLASFETPATAANSLLLWYDKPAAGWNEALPLGNGRLAAMVFGGVQDDLLRLNESTLSAGGPHDYANPEAGKNLAELRDLIFRHEIGPAQKLVTEGLMGNPALQQPFQPFCDLRLRFADAGEMQQYRRELDLDSAIASVTYRLGDTRFRREVFISQPDQVLIVRLTADRPGRITAEVALDSQQPGVEVAATGRDTLRLAGSLGPRERPQRDGLGRMNFNAGWDGRGLQFCALVHARVDGGKVRIEGSKLQIRGADSAILLFSGATSFNNYHDISGDAVLRARRYLDGATVKSFDQLRRDHLADYRRFFRRVQLDLGSTGPAAQPTDVRLKAFATAPDPQFAAVLYQFGRYLLISSSRPGSQPPNLQGMWNQDIWPIWGSKYTTNINLQMNYWPAEVTNLSELHEPLFDLIDDLRVTGAVAAKTHYHAGGFVLHHNTDLWRGASPVDGYWGMWPVGAAWLCQHLWDHYEFTGDLIFLRRRAYPALKEAAQFMLDFLVEAPPGVPFAGYLVTNPSTSPENGYRLGALKSASLTYAATMDIELIQDLFDRCAQASRILGVDAEFRDRIEATQRRLPPLQIGRRGQLQEWIEDYEDSDPHHRHTSHLYAVYPSSRITPERTPELAAAARKTLDLRGEGSTGWSRAWRISLWSRLKDAGRAYSELEGLATRTTLPDLFSDCPPMQVDGSFGATAGITEMLLQSHGGVIQLLPALPAVWPVGKLTGVRARGGIGVNIEWRSGKLTKAVLYSQLARTCLVRYQEKEVEIKLRSAGAARLDGNLEESK